MCPDFSRILLVLVLIDGARDEQEVGRRAPALSGEQPARNHLIEIAAGHTVDDAVLRGESVMV